jgi:hypothetical protein
VDVKTPRRPTGAGGGEERSHRLAVRATTHALFAGKVQRKVRNCVAQLAAAGSSLDRPKIAAIPAISAMRLDDQAPAQHPPPRSWHLRHWGIASIPLLCDSSQAPAPGGTASTTRTFFFGEAHLHYGCTGKFDTMNSPWRRRSPNW